jgi:hypothetical protein
MAVTASQLREYLQLPPDIVTVTGDATINRAAFIAAVTEGGTYVFTKGDNGWTLNSSAAVLSEYGITADVVETEITVEYTTIPVDAYINAAKSKARAAGIPEFQNNAQYDLFIMALAAMYYDNRGMTFQNPADAANAERMINSFVLELRYGDEDA